LLNPLPVLAGTFALRAERTVPRRPDGKPHPQPGTARTADVPDPPLRVPLALFGLIGGVELKQR
jgi:hypothetical protein